MDFAMSNTCVCVGPRRELSDIDSSANLKPHRLQMKDPPKEYIYDENPTATIQTASIKSVCGNIIDIRREDSTLSLANLIRTGICCKNGVDKSLPSLTLWDSRGLELFEKVTRLPDYYLGWVEREILEQRCQEIAQRISPGTMLVDLGSGDTQKVRPILQALDQMGCGIDYYALDLSEFNLQTSVANLSRLPFKYVHCHGLLGTFDDAKAWLQTPEVRHRPKCLLSLGSSLGNMPKWEAASFLNGFVEVLKCQHVSALSKGKQIQSLMIVGLDSCKDQVRVRKAYDDPAKFNANFLLNSLRYANLVLGNEIFKLENWSVYGEWINGGYRQSLVPLSEVVFENSRIKARERVHIVQSEKYDAVERDLLWTEAGLQELHGWPSLDTSLGNDPMISLLRVEDGLQRGDSGIGMLE